MRHVYTADGARVLETCLGEHTDKVYGVILRADYTDTRQGRASAALAAADLARSEIAIKAYERLTVWNPFRIRPHGGVG